MTEKFIEGNLFFMKLEEAEAQIGQKLSELDYIELANLFPDGSAYQEVAKVLQKKREEWQKMNPEVSSELKTVINSDGTVSSK